MTSSLLLPGDGTAGGDGSGSGGGKDVVVVEGSGSVVVPGAVVPVVTTDVVPVSVGAVVATESDEQPAAKPSSAVTASATAAGRQALERWS
jgi:hypothetical protein